MHPTVSLDIHYRRNIWACYFFDALTGIHFSSAIIIPFFLDWGKLSYVQIYSLQSWYLIWALLLEVPTGVIADRFGKKIALSLGTIIGAAGLFIFGTTSNVFLFFIAEFLAALSAALISGAFEAIFYDSLILNGLTKVSKRIFGRSHAFRMTGAVLAAPIGAFLATYFQLNIPILLDGAVLLIAFVVTFFITEKTAKIIDTRINPNLNLLKEGFFFLRSHVEAKNIAILMTIIGVAAYYFIWLYQPLLAEAKVPLQHYGWFSALFLGTQIILGNSFEKIEQWIPSIEHYIQTSLLVILCSFLLVLFFPSIYTVILFILVGSHTNSQLRYISAHINQWIPGNQRATVLSILNMVQSIFIAMMNPLLGFISDHSVWMGIGFLFTFLLACTFIGFIGIIDNNSR